MDGTQPAAATISTFGNASGQCLESANQFAACLTRVVINPIIALVFAAGLLIFVYGIVEFLMALNSEAGERDKGKRHMLYGILGMFIMVSAYAILNIVANTLGPSATQYLH
ncbi:MAG TPA: hypothetical protein VG753_02280 [Candidatus Paceibacterota bacterium]|nr:hypothetical protein [Candidatus Paceibacterota bacterium]